MQSTETESAAWLPTGNQGVETITIDELNQKMRDLREAKTQHEALKEQAGEAFNLFKERKKEILNILKSKGMHDYRLADVGLVYLTEEVSFTTPKSVEEKMALYGYIEQKYGPEALEAMRGINSQTLNAWAKKEVEADPLVRIPGLAEPTIDEDLNFRKK